MPISPAAIKLKKEYEELQKNPNNGFSVGLVDDDNLFEWNVTLMGPQDTNYEGGIFEARMVFPEDYPMRPPNLKFKTKMWHPNVYKDGTVCASILHPPGEDANGYENANERWNPALSAETVLISIIWLLTNPNDESPANIDAAKEWREDKAEYKRKVLKYVANSIETFGMD